MKGIKELSFPKKGHVSHQLNDDLVAEQWIVPAGVVVKLVTAKNFGVVVLPWGTVDKRGFVIPRQLFRW